jgi:hypothetical protein
MLCVSVLSWWFLSTLGPNPIIMARFEDQATCRYAAAQVAHTFVLYPERLFPVGVAEAKK